MKKFLLGAAAFSLLFAASCKKSDDNNNAIGNWKLGGTTYNATETDSIMNSSTYNLYANDASGNQITFTFNNSMPATGSFKVVNYSQLTPGGTNAVTIQTLNTALSAYASTGNDNMSAAVTVNNGKISITVPSVWMKNQNGTDSLQLTATINQK